MKDDLKMIRKFDGSHATVKKTFPSPKVAQLEARFEVGVFAGDAKPSKAVFESDSARFQSQRERSPGPA